MKNFILPILVLSWFFFQFGCIPPPPTSKYETAPDISPKIAVKRGDTLTYTVEFYNQTEKNNFTKALREFIDSYHFSGLSFDSTYNQILLRVFQSPQSTTSESIASVQRVHFSEDIIEKSKEGTDNNGNLPPEKYTEPVTGATKDSTLPAFGGTIRLYSHRSSIDQTLAQLTLPEPTKTITDSGLCTFADSTPGKILLKLNDRATNARKRTISTIDLIQQWTTYVKNCPAEGLALFSGIEGVNEFINGKEALIRGISAIDQKTIQLKYESPQQFATTRLKTPRLLVSTLLLGPYYEEKTGSEIVLLPDTASQKRKAFLDKIIIKTGGDPNPVLSFSLNRFDALILNSLTDINYARTTLADKAILHKIISDRYFISCNIQDMAVRASLRNIVNPDALVKNYLKIEAQTIASTASDIPVIPRAPESKTIVPIVSGPVKILFRKDDFISRSIAEKLMADLSKTGLSCVMTGLESTRYERALVAKDYSCAIGWVTDLVLTSHSEKLRLATIWFNNDTDEEKRIQEYRELPLFSVNTYLCTRKNVRLCNNSLEGIYIAKE